MRLLFLLPHFYQPAAGTHAFYGSEISPATLRRDQVARSIAALHQTFGHMQAIMHAPHKLRANETLAHHIDVVLVTTGDTHLADHLPRDLFIEVKSRVEPRHLGFLCQSLMRDNLGRSDFSVFLEDDIAITDPLFFDKLTWFNAAFGPTALLQPHRFEVADDLPIKKLYVDGAFTDPGYADPFQDISIRPELTLEAFGRPHCFCRTENVHSGFFALDAAQLARAVERPGFAEPTEAFVGPLESAATLMIMQTFDVYKPALDTAGFLEIHHLGSRFLVPEPAPDPAPDPAPEIDPDSEPAPETHPQPHPEPEPEPAAAPEAPPATGPETAPP